MAHGNATIPPQDNTRVDQLVREVFTPHLQRALAEAKETAPFNEMVSASAMAYANMLETTLGKKAACDLLRGLANHLELTERANSTRAN